MKRRVRELTRRRVRRSPFLIAAVLLTPLLLVGLLSQRVTVSQSSKTRSSNEAEVTKHGVTKSHSLRKKESPRGDGSRTRAIRPQPIWQKNRRSTSLATPTSILNGGGNTRRLSRNTSPKRCATISLCSRSTRTTFSISLEPTDIG